MGGQSLGKVFDVLVTSVLNTFSVTRLTDCPLFLYVSCQHVISILKRHFNRLKMAQVVTFNDIIKNQSNSNQNVYFRFSPRILTVNHFYYPTNALNYIKLRG